MKLKELFSIKSFSLVITFGILLLLFSLGPAQAFVIGLDILNNEVIKGNIIGFIGEIDMQSNEHFPIDYLELSLDGPETVNCRFFPNGTVISDCSDITIKLIEIPNYGYGYGYGGYGYGYSNGKLIYSFKLDTDDYNTGTYTTMLSVIINNKTFSETGDNIIINKKSSSSSGSGSRRIVYKDKIIYQDKIIDKDCEDCKDPITPKVITNTKIEKEIPRWIKGIILLLIIGIGVLSYYLIKTIKDNQLPDEENDVLPEEFKLDNPL